MVSKRGGSRALKSEKNLITQWTRNCETKVRIKKGGVFLFEFGSRFDVKGVGLLS